MKKPKLRELKEAFKSLFSRAYTTKFPYGPPIPVPKGFRGRPRFNEKICVGCGACALVCPVGVIQIKDDAKTAKRTFKQIQDLCVYCGQCERYCISKTGITLTEEYDVATYDRNTYRDGIEKKLTLCESCGTIIGPEDHIKWIANRVGEAAFSNPTLMLTLLQETAGLKRELSDSDRTVKRSNRIRILCHKCRKIMTLK